MNLLIISIAPSITFLIWIYLKDKYEKEPIIFLLKLFFIGALTSIPAIIIEDILFKLDINNIYIKMAYVSFIVAAFSEEILKSIALIIFTLKNRHFTEKLDGIVYSIFVSLGFATIENIIYIVNGNNTQILELGLSRAVISIPAHIMFAITMGYYLSLYKFTHENKKLQKTYLIKSILIPILQHGVFDFILMFKSKSTLLLFFIYLIYLWKINLDKLDEYTNYARKRAYRFKKLKLRLKLNRKNK
ncbi:MAG: PrsW family intramembrane metalloprotease [Paraclostridium sp.]